MKAHHHPATSSTGALAPVLLALATFLPLPAAAQSHQARQGEFVLRSSVVASTSIPSGTAREHGLERGPHHAVLNVVVLQGHGKHRHPVAADVTAQAAGLGGVGKRQIAMHEARAPNGDVSYVGSFDFASREVLGVHVRARPHGEGSRELALDYRERMPVR